MVLPVSNSPNLLELLGNKLKKFKEDLSDLSVLKVKVSKTRKLEKYPLTNNKSLACKLWE